MSTIRPSVIATLATKEALTDLRLLLQSIAFWNFESVPRVYLFCDSAVADALKDDSYPGGIFTKTTLDAYSGKTRQQLEQEKGVTYPSRWFDFMAEKLALMEWVFQAEPKRTEDSGVLFCDADIFFLAPLPEIPTDALVALSQHEIRPTDEQKYGVYNGGFFWFSDSAIVSLWREACLNGTRFFEQSALEEVARSAQSAKPDGGLYRFPRQQNYGWWRLFQGSQPPQILLQEWTMNKVTTPISSGILVRGIPLGSIHTHFRTQDRITTEFNMWVMMWLEKLAPIHPPAECILQMLKGAVQN